MATLIHHFTVAQLVEKIQSLYYRTYHAELVIRQVNQKRPGLVAALPYLEKCFFMEKQKEALYKKRERLRETNRRDEDIELLYADACTSAALYLKQFREAINGLPISNAL